MFLRNFGLLYKFKMTFDAWTLGLLHWMSDRKILKHFIFAAFPLAVYVNIVLLQ